MSGVNLSLDAVVIQSPIQPLKLCGFMYMPTSSAPVSGECWLIIQHPVVIEKLLHDPMNRL